MDWTHNSLLDDLIGHLKAPATMVWGDIQLGPSGSVRPDVYLLHKSFVRPNPIAYECKVSRSDFIADISAGKWISYQKYAYAVVFAAPNGLISAKEVPSACGLLLRHEKVWRYAKRPVINPVEIPQKALLKLLIDGVHREGPSARIHQYVSYYSSKKFSKKFGEEAAIYIRDAALIHNKVATAKAKADSIIQSAREEAERIHENAIENLPELWRELCELLKISANSKSYAVRIAIRNKLVNSDNGFKEKYTELLDSIYQIQMNGRNYLRTHNG